MAEQTWRVPARIETERLVLRCYTLDDVPAMDEVIPANRDHLLEFMLWAEHEPVSTDERRLLVEKFTAAFAAGTDYSLGMFSRATGEYVGSTGLHVREDHLEVGYWIAAAHEGTGLVSESSAALTRVALEYSGAPFAAICCEPANERSRRVALRLGYTYFGMRDVEGRQLEQYRLTREQFPGSPAASWVPPRLFDRDGSSLAWPA